MGYNLMVVVYNKLLKAVSNGSSLPGLTTLLAVLFLLLVPFYLLARPAFAAGDTIRVLSDATEVRFPGDVVFNLEVEGESDIVEVRLYFRVPPSGMWMYTYPDLAPSRHVRTRFDLDISGISYLPPGTELEYYYSVVDSRGNVLDTSPETFMYVDGRFRWRSTRAGPLEIYWHDLSDKRVQEVARQVEVSLQEIAALLETGLDRPMRGIIYNSRSEAREAFPFQSQTTTEQQVFQGFAFPERGVFVGIGLRPGLIVHESAHLMLEEATDSPGARLPAWVNEGFATYVEPGGHRDSRVSLGGASARDMPLRHMYAIPGNLEGIRYFYLKAGSVVGYLLENHGPEKFRGFLGQLDQGKSADNALNAAYGFGLDGLDQRWSSALGQDAGSDDGGVAVPFSSLGTVLIAVLVMIVMAVTVASYVVRRQRKRAEGPEDWDSLTEEEWEGRP